MRRELHDVTMKDLLPIEKVHWKVARFCQSVVSIICRIPIKM